MRRVLTGAFSIVVGLAWLGDRPTRLHHSSGPQFTATYVEAAGFRLRMAVGGEGAPTLVLLHGYGESLVTWREVANALAPRGRVVALDLPGHGLSAKPRSAYDIESLASVVAEALQQVSSSPVVLIGHSMGGAIAVWVALKYPERVSALVLVDAAGLSGPVLSSVGRLAPGVVVALLGAGSAMRSPHDHEWLRESDAALAYQPSADPTYYEALRAMLEEFDFTALDSVLPRIRQPALLIWGRHDQLTPVENALRFQARLPNNTLVVLEDALHRPQLTHPDQVAEFISEFVRTLEDRLWRDTVH